jgi:HPt (histidine-containing phosphotransfer) domain-containing protein
MPEVNIKETSSNDAALENFPATALIRPASHNSEDHFPEFLVGFDLAGTRARLDNDEALLALVLRQFVADFNDWPTEFEHAVATEDTKAQMHLAHSLKGAAANVGAEKISASAQEFEQALREQTGRLSLRLAQNCIENLREALGILSTALKPKSK